MHMATSLRQIHLDNILPYGPRSGSPDERSKVQREQSSVCRGLVCLLATILKSISTLTPPHPEPEEGGTGSHQRLGPIAFSFRVKNEQFIYTNMHYKMSTILRCLYYSIITCRDQCLKKFHPKVRKHGEGPYQGLLLVESG